jgi:hypothetical protein
LITKRRNIVNGKATRLLTKRFRVWIAVGDIGFSLQNIHTVYGLFPAFYSWAPGFFPENKVAGLWC